MQIATYMYKPYVAYLSFKYLENRLTDQPKAWKVLLSKLRDSEGVKRIIHRHAHISSFQPFSYQQSIVYSPFEEPATINDIQLLRPKTLNIFILLSLDKILTTFPCCDHVVS